MKKKKNCIRSILREHGRNLDTENNFSEKGLTVSDTSNWVISENWISKLKGIKWNNETPKRLVELRWDIYVSKINSIDFKDCEFLEALGLWVKVGSPGGLPLVNLQNNIKLRSLFLTRLEIGDNTFINNPALDSLSIRECKIEKGSLNLSKSTELRYLCSSYNFDIISLNVKNCKN